jgi:hypothetical protein
MLQIFAGEIHFVQKGKGQIFRGSLPDPLHQSHFSRPRAPSQKPLPSQRLHCTEVEGRKKGRSKKSNPSTIAIKKIKNKSRKNKEQEPSHLQDFDNNIKNK